MKTGGPQDGKWDIQPRTADHQGDYILMLCQAFQLWAGKAGFWDVPRDSYYAQAVMFLSAGHYRRLSGRRVPSRITGYPPGCCGVP